MPASADSPGSPSPQASQPWFAPAVFAATACGIGRVPFAPGTFGALLGVPLSIGIPICSRAAAALGRKDPGAIVLDEVASMPLAVLFVPPAARTPALLAVAFVLLRIFDIGKPFPCRQLERLPAGLGIMADDWGAAAWTAACLAVARWQHWI